MISVIVPVHNVEKYIEDCIQSILQQTYKDFELFEVMIDPQIHLLFDFSLIYSLEMLYTFHRGVFIIPLKKGFQIGSAAGYYFNLIKKIYGECIVKEN